MTEIIIAKSNPYDVDASKDCVSFKALDDGTISGDKKYCDLSFMCKQIGMLSQFVEIKDQFGNIVLMDYLCTGKYPIWEERSADDKAS